jgi:hypothetical protein
MGEIKAFQAEKLIAGIMFTDESSLNEALSRLEEQFGKIERLSEFFPFKYTTYYDSEMECSGIKKVFVSFESCVDPEDLASIKILTNSIEDGFILEGGGRSINIDPGLLNLGHIVLATTKAMGHRIALKDGIYGEVTVVYMKGGYQSLKWTYADYRDVEVMKFFQKVREDFKKLK